MSDPFTIPELMRGMRAFAAPKALGGAHDRYFAPLLDARRAAKAATRWASRVTALDAERLEATMRATVRGFAAERYPDSAPDQRALAARLEDACDELFARLLSLGTAQGAVQGAEDDERRAGAWHGWTAALLEMFAAADRGWERLSALLVAAPAGYGPPTRKARRPRRPRKER